MYQFLSKVNPIYTGLKQKLDNNKTVHTLVDNFQSERKRKTNLRSLLKKLQPLVNYWLYNTQTLQNTSNIYIYISQLLN